MHYASIFLFVVTFCISCDNAKDVSKIEHVPKKQNLEHQVKNDIKKHPIHQFPYDKVLTIKSFAPYKYHYHSERNYPNVKAQTYLDPYGKNIPNYRTNAFQKIRLQSGRPFIRKYTHIMYVYIYVDEERDVIHKLVHYRHKAPEYTTQRFQCLNKNCSWAKTIDLFKYYRSYSGPFTYNSKTTSYNTKVVLLMPKEPTWKTYEDYDKRVESHDHVRLGAVDQKQQVHYLRQAIEYVHESDRGFRKPTMGYNGFRKPTLNGCWIRDSYSRIRRHYTWSECVLMEKYPQNQLTFNIFIKNNKYLFGLAKDTIDTWFVKSKKPYWKLENILQTMGFLYKKYPVSKVHEQFSDLRINLFFNGDEKVENVYHVVSRINKHFPFRFIFAIGSPNSSYNAYEIEKFKKIRTKGYYKAGEFFRSYHLRKEIKSYCYRNSKIKNCAPIDMLYKKYDHKYHKSWRGIKI